MLLMSPPPAGGPKKPDSIEGLTAGILVLFRFQRRFLKSIY
jgi:hypothetical protein